MLPVSLTHYTEVDSVVLPNRVYKIKPLSMSTRTERRRITASYQLKVNDVRTELNDYRQEIDFSPWFTEEECQEIKTISAELNNQNRTPVDAMKMRLIVAAESRAAMEDEKYDGLLAARQNLMDQSELDGLSFFIHSIVIDGTEHVIEDRKEFVQWVEKDQLPEEDYELLMAKTANFARLTEEAEKNSVPSATLS